jgi:replicative DNA helicase
MQEGIHYSKEIEAAILGQCLCDKNSFGRIYGLLEEKYLYVEDGQKTFSVMKEMFQDGLPIDVLTVWEKLISKRTELKWSVKFGNPTNDPAGDINRYLVNLTNSCHFNTTYSLEYYCHLVKEFWKKRELEKITRSGIDLEGDTSKQGWEINSKINEILSSEVKQDWYSYEDLMFNLLVHQSEISSGKKQLTTTSFKAVDKLNGGFSGGNLVVIGARPSVGKSALVNKIAFGVANTGKPVGIISLEMNNTEIAARLASLDTQTSFGVIYRNLFNDEHEKEYFERKIGQASSTPIYVSDKTKVDVNEIKAKAIKLKHKHGCSMLIVDYLQLVDSVSSKNGTREQEVAKISRGLKLIAMELDIPVIVLCQLNRAVTARKEYKNRLPQLSDLRESGAIEQDADVVMMLHRDSMSGFETIPLGQVNAGMSTERTADLLCLKWRNGAPFHIELDFDPPLMKFSEKGSNLIPVHIAKDEDQREYF